MSRAAVDIRPFIGLRYFEERDAHLFYGRDEHVSELLGKVAENRFVAVMGSSGCGKSSLVRAGLLPELRSGMIPKAGPRWKVVEFRPGNAPLQELAKAIRKELGVELAQALVEEGPLGIARAVAEAKLDEGTNVLVIADQFEEVFRYQREESDLGRGVEAGERCQALTRRLLDAAAQPELPIYVLLVMRSDYLGECAQFPDLPERMSESLYLVPRLRRDQLQEAINAPVGGEIEPAVVQRLLSEVGSDPDQLPRLQHLLGRMWDRSGGGRLTMQHYTDAGGWEKGLEQHLDKVYETLSASQKTVCARVFQQLSELDKGRAVRRPTDVTSLREVCGKEAPTVVARFRDEGFITPRENPVDIMHECILREWPLLKEWLEKENRSARRLDELAGAAKDAGWQPGLTAEQEKSIRGLAGLTLQNLSGWRDDAQPTAAWARRYRTAVDFDTAYGYLRWSEARDQEQKTRRRWLTGILVGLVAVAAVLACIMAGFAGTYRRQGFMLRMAGLQANERAESAFANANAANKKAQKALDDANAARTEAVYLRHLADEETREARRQKIAAEANAAKAEHQKSVAQSRQLAAQSISYLQSLPDLARLLAVESVRTADTLEGRDALLAAVDSSSCLDTILPDFDSPRSMTFSRDGGLLAIPSLRGLWLWDVKARARLPDPPMPNLQSHLENGYGSHSVSFSPDGKWMAANVKFDYASRAAVVIWPLASGHLGNPKVLADEHGLFSVTFSPDSRLLASGGQQGVIEVWEGPDWSPKFHIADAEKEINQLRFAAGGRILVAGYFDGGTKIWRMDSDASGAKSEPTRPDRHLLAVSDQGATMVVTDGPNRTADGPNHSPKTSVKFIDPDTDTLRGELIVHSEVTSAVISSDERLLVLSGGGNRLSVWERPGDSFSDWKHVDDIKTLLSSNYRNAETMAMSPDSHWLASGSWFGHDGIWDLTRRGRELNRPRTEQTAFPLVRRFFIECSVVDNPCRRGLVRVIDTTTQQPVGPEIQVGENSRSIAVTGDGGYLVAADGPIWNVATGKQVGTLKLPDAGSSVWTISKDLPSLSHDQFVFQASYQVGNSVRYFLGLGSPRSSAPPKLVPLDHEFLENLLVAGTLVAGAYRDQIEIRNASDLGINGPPLKTVGVSTSKLSPINLRAMAISNNGVLLAACSNSSGEVYLFDLPSRQQFATVLETGFDGILALAFSLAGDEVFVQATSGRWFRWRIGGEPLSALALHQANRVLSATERKRYLGE